MKSRLGLTFAFVLGSGQPGQCDGEQQWHAGLHARARQHQQRRGGAGRDAAGTAGRTGGLPSCHAAAPVPAMAPARAGRLPALLLLILNILSFKPGFDAQYFITCRPLRSL